MIKKLFKIIQDRQKRMPKDSYIASLFREGKDRIVQKVGEEAVEVLIAAKGKNKTRIIAEIADLWFHTLILMSSVGISPKDIYQEFKKRRKK